MSFNRVFPHQSAGYIEAIVDGYEDWLSATQVIEEMTGLAEDLSIPRILIDFSNVDMRVAPVEAPDVATFFNSFACCRYDLALIAPTSEKGRQTVEAFGAAIAELGHKVSYLADAAARQAWIDGNELRQASA